jgi:transposase InsO family protein
MPWKVHDVVEQRLRFLMEWQKQEFGLAELCRQYEITRQTGYKWLNRYEAEGLEGLRDRSRAPHEHPNEIEEAVEQQVLAVRAKYPLWGARKIRVHLERSGCCGAVPAASTIGLILKAHGLTVARKGRVRGARRTEPLAEANGPNRVWCADFKGWFLTGDGKRCDPLTITDGYSRYLLRCQAVKGADTLHAKPVFEAAFREFGMPERLRTDNGAPFGSNGDTGLSALAVWWIKLGIWPERIRPGKPQENGRHERMHLTLKQATASPPAGTWREQQRRFSRFRQEYNEERPHEALGQVPPAEFYQPSGREWPRKLPEVSYGKDVELRWVEEGGRIRWRGQRVFVSHALAGEPVGLEQIGPEAWRVSFSFYFLGVTQGNRTRLWTPEQWRQREKAEEG